MKALGAEVVNTQTEEGRKAPFSLKSKWGLSIFL